MTAIPIPSARPARPARPSRPRRAPALAAGGVALATAAVFAAPGPVARLLTGHAYAGEAGLGRAVSDGLVRLVAGQGVTPAGLEDVTRWWAVFHGAKAVLGVVLLALVAGALRRTWAALLAAPRAPRRLALTALTAAEAGLGLLALLVVVANVQGMLAPLASAVGLAPLAAPGPALAPALSSLTAEVAAGRPGGPASLLLDDFVRYHVVMTGLGAATTLGLLALAVGLWRRRRGASPDSRAARRRARLHVTAAASVVLLALLFAVVTAANLSTVLRPGPAFVALLGGGG